MIEVFSNARGVAKGSKQEEPIRSWRNALTPYELL